MSDSPLMSKMDALLKKHRGGADAPIPAPESPTDTAALAAPPLLATPDTVAPAASEAPPNAWLPVLTHVIERGTPPPAPIVMVTEPVAVAVSASPALPLESAAPSSIPEAEGTPQPDQSVQPPPPPQPAVADPTVSEAAISDSMAEQLMSELAPRLSEVMEKQVAAELRKNLDQTVANLLSQLDVNVREIVRDAVTEKLKQPRTPAN